MLTTLWALLAGAHQQVMRRDYSSPSGACESAYPTQCPVLDSGTSPADSYQGSEGLEHTMDEKRLKEVVVVGQLGL